MTAAEATLGLPLAQGAPARELPLLVAQIRMFEAHLKQVEAEMVTVLRQLPEAKYLLTIPGVAEVTAATFLGCVGDVRVYESSKQILRLAGLSLVEASSGTRKGRERISKRGRPVLRRYAYLLALRCVQKSGFFRKEFEAMVERNGGLKIKAIAALSRDVLRILFTVARERRDFVLVHVPADMRRAALLASTEGDAEPTA